MISAISRIAAAALALFLLGAGPAAADLPQTERIRLAEAVDQFNADFATGNNRAIIEGMHPGILAHFSEMTGMAPSVLKATLISQIDEMMSQVTIISFNMDLTRADYGRTEIGRSYALIPTETVLKMDGVGEVQSQTTTIAVLDEGVWYLIRVDSPQQLDVLRTVMPDMAGIAVPEGNVEIIGQ